MTDWSDEATPRAAQHWLVWDKKTRTRSCRGFRTPLCIAIHDVRDAPSRELTRRGYGGCKMQMCRSAYGRWLFVLRWMRASRRVTAGCPVTGQLQTHSPGRRRPLRVTADTINNRTFNVSRISSAECHLRRPFNPTICMTLQSAGRRNVIYVCCPTAHSVTYRERSL